jgi:hypothetical protein
MLRATPGWGAVKVAVRVEDNLIRIGVKRETHNANHFSEWWERRYWKNFRIR